MTLPRHCPSRKHPHATHKSAKTAASVVEKNFGIEINTYKCPHCHHWHLTSRKNLKHAS